MQIVIELDSFWVGFSAGVLVFFLVGLTLAARMNRKAAKLAAQAEAESGESPRANRPRR